MTQDKISRAKELNEQLTRFDFEYFTNNKSIISDDEYDQLWFELKTLLEDEGVKKALSKTDMSLGVQTSFLSKVAHTQPVLSLDKEKIDDVNFQKKLKRFIDNYETDGKWTISSKLDGLTLVGYKQKDRMTFATRGGSTSGENVTHQFHKHSELENASKHVPNSMTIRGEGIILKQSFNDLLEKSHANILSLYEKFSNDSDFTMITLSNDEIELIERYKDFDRSLKSDDVAKRKLLTASLNSQITACTDKADKSRIRKIIAIMKEFFIAREGVYANARNLASASVRTNNQDAAFKNGVRFVAYDIMNSQSFGIVNETDVIDALDEYGFETVQQLVVTTDELLEFFKDDSKMNKWRDESPYEIDGLVIKPNLKIENPEITGHHVKGQLAVKFKAQGAVSRLRNVEWNLTSNGRYSPVAIFDPVEINGSLIQKASLASVNTINTLDLKIGDQIYVIRANDVIPKIDHVIKDARTGTETEIQLPEDSVLRGQILYAKDQSELSLDKRIHKFLQRLGSKGIGLTLIKQLVNAGFLESIADVFLLKNHRDLIIQSKKVRMSHALVDQMLSEIDLVEASLTFEAVIDGLGIEGLGKRGLEDIIDFVPNMNSFKNLTNEMIDDAVEKFGLTLNNQKCLRRLVEKSDDLYDLHEMGLI